MADSAIETTYKSQVGNSHQAGLQAVYDAGHAAGQVVAKAETTTALTETHKASLLEKVEEAFKKGYAEAKAEFEAGLHSLEDSKKTTGATSDEEKNAQAGKGQASKTAEAGKIPAS
jgi:hypothetical protein